VYREAYSYAKIPLSHYAHMRLIAMHTCCLSTCTVGGSRNDVLTQQHDSSQIIRTSSGINANINAASSNSNMMAWSANISSMNTNLTDSAKVSDSVTAVDANDSTVVPPQVEMMLEKYSDILMGMLERKMNN
jgi:hypothetical protein